MEKNWLIISWAHKDFMDGRYGVMIDQCYGTQEQAYQLAKTYVPDHSPIGLVGEII